ncbi:MAG: N-acyl homoserine lactonase family protein [Hydrogenophilales bacterium]|nr:N-acyl homoserine lactonase family protein [Hydrogenophilales bacterium]
MNKVKSLTLFALAILAPFLLAGCTSTPPRAEAGLRLYVLDCGSIEVLDVSVFHPGIDQGKRKLLTDSCYLIVHPKGTLLWDAGLPDALANTPEGVLWFDTFRLKVSKPLGPQLQQIGYPAETIQYLGISHLHGDHIGNVNLLPKATLLMQAEEYAAGFGAEPGKYGFDPSGYASLRGNPVQQLQGDYDVFGDGSVIIKRTPGHTPGHQALFVKLRHSGNILLSGDLVHFTDNWTHKRVPGFNFDKEQSVKTMHEMEQFLKDNRATLWIQHDLEQNAGIKRAPAYYD